MPYLDDVLNPYQSLTGDLTPEDTLTGLLTEDGQLQGALAISDVVGVTQLTELTDVDITNPLNNDVLTYNDVTEKWENMPAQGGGGGGTSDYNDLDNKPSINSVTLSGNQTTSTLGLFSGDYDDLTNKPELATVATSGSYDDLTDTPTIPAAQVNSDWDAVEGVEQILNKPSLATVATSGSYNDLTDKPVEATSISVTASSDMPAGFPVPDVCRRGKVVIVRFNVNMPARTYLTTETIWNLSKKPVMVTNFTVTNILGDTIPMYIHSTDGKIRISNQRTLNSNSYFLGELVYLTDED